MAFAQTINFGHTQQSGCSTASFGVFHTEYDDYTDVFYWKSASRKQNFIPTAYSGIDQNYWNAGISSEYNDIFASLIFYEQIANYKNWPSNMTDLGLAVTLGIGDMLTLQARYYDFCYSGGKGTAMPGLSIAKSFGQSDYQNRIAAGCDWSFWYLEPWNADVMFPRTFIKFDHSKDSSNGFGFKYLAVFRLKGPGNQTKINKISIPHTFSLWAGVAKEIDNFSIGLRPTGFITLNAVNPTDLHTNKKGQTEDYNPFAKNGNMEFLIRLPFAVTYHVTEHVDLVFSVLFGLYYANFDHEGYTGLGGNNKKGWVNEKGIGLGANFNISPRCKIQIASNFIRIPELTGTGSSDAFENHVYTAEDISAASIGKAPLTLSGKFLF